MGKEVQVSYWFISFIAFWTLGQMEHVLCLLHHESMNSMVMLPTCADPCCRACDPVPPAFQLQGTVCQLLTVSFSLKAALTQLGPLPRKHRRLWTLLVRSVPWLIISWCGGTQGPFLRVRQGLLHAPPGLLAGPGIAWTTDQMSVIIFFPLLSPFSLIHYGFLLRTLLQNTRYTNSAFQGPVLESDYKTICVGGLCLPLSHGAFSSLNWCLLDDHLRKAKWEM